MRLRDRKHRYGKPLAVMVRDAQAARAICTLTQEEEALLTTAARPIVLARAREGCAIAEGVAPGIPWLGVFLPYAPLQHLLFASGQVQALVMTLLFVRGATYYSSWLTGYLVSGKYRYVPHISASVAYDYASIRSLRTSSCFYSLRASETCPLRWPNLKLTVAIAR